MSTTIYEGNTLRKESEDTFGEWLESIVLVGKDGIPLLEINVLPKDESSDPEGDRVRE